MVTGGRADWGLLLPVAQQINAASDMELILMATGQHAVPGSQSLAALDEAGFAPAVVIDLELDASPDTLAAARATGLATARIADELARLDPDVMIVLGDRYEILGAASAALVMGVPIAHLCGGDITEGAFDDAIRHAITKMAHLHFVTTENAARRVRQMGEPADRVFHVGSTGLDTILQTELIERTALAKDLGLDCGREWAVVALHPETRGLAPDAIANVVLEALGRFSGLSYILTGSNADPGSDRINLAFKHFASGHEHAVFFELLGSQRFISALRHARLMIGNSSAGLYEAPSLNVATIDIGDRQKGRDKAASVLNTAYDVADICDAMEKGLALSLDAVKNPYGDGQSAARIVSVLRDFHWGPDLLRKEFVDMHP